MGGFTSGPDDPRSDAALVMHRTQCAILRRLVEAIRKKQKQRRIQDDERVSR